MGKKNFILIFIFLLSLPILIPDGNAEEICDPESITISCSEDAYVTQNNPDTNYGMASSFVVGTKNDDLYEAFLYFDLTEMALLEDITSITLILPIYYAPRAMEIDVYLITETWDEYSITYNTKPSLGDYYNSLSIGIHTSYFTTTYELDITDIAKGKSEISLGLQTADTSNSNHYIHADSKDGFSTGARLEVDYLECYEVDIPIPEGDDWIEICPLNPYEDFLNAKSDHTYKFSYEVSNTDQKIRFGISDSNDNYLHIQKLDENLKGTFTFTAEKTETLFILISVDLFTGHCVYVKFSYSDITTNSIPGYNPLILFSCILLGMIIIFMKKSTTKLKF